MSLSRVKRLLPDSEYRVVAEVVRTDSLPEKEIQRLRGLVRGWHDKYVQRARRQAREARGKGKPRATRGSESNENTMRQADVMDWVLDRLTELEARGGEAPQEAGREGRAAASTPSKTEVRKAIGEPHVSTFGDLWAEFPDAPVEKVRKALWALVEDGEVELDTAGGIRLTAEDQVAFVEEIQAIGGVPVRRREKAVPQPQRHQKRLTRTKVVRIRAHTGARTKRRQSRRDRRS